MKTKDIIIANTFQQISHDEFGTELQIEPMSQWKMKNIQILRDKLYENYDYSSATTYEFPSPLQEKRRKKIFEDERHSIDTSIETLRFLNLIIYNIVHITQNNISVPGVVAVGKYLRTRGQYIDYVKLDSWIAQLRIKGMASLIASILKLTFSFESNELPFLYKVYTKAHLQLCNQISNDHNKSLVRHSSQIFTYSPIAVLSIWHQKIVSLLSNIEE